MYGERMARELHVYNPGWICLPISILKAVSVPSMITSLATIFAVVSNVELIK